MAARELRYDWFYSLMFEHKFSYLAIAHNANDNVETLYLNLLRGSGLDGICAIKETVEIDYKGYQFTIIRPLLEYTRREIEHHINNTGISFRVDSTNLENNYSRNKIRNLVIPYFEQINPSTIKSVNRSIRYFSMANSILHTIESKVDKKLSVPLSNFSTSNPSFPFLEKVIDVPALLEEKNFEYWLFCLLAPFGFNSANVESIALCLQDTETKRFLSGSNLLIKERSLLKIYSIEILKVIDELVVNSLEDIISGTNSLNFGSVSIKFEYYKLDNNASREQLLESFRQNGKTMDSYSDLYLDCSKLSFPLRIRAFRAGDKVKLLGMNGEKKISDFFTDIKIDNSNRSLVPLITFGSKSENIAAIVGYRIDKRYCVDMKTIGYLHVTCGINCYR